MVNCRKQLVPMITATSLLLASGALATGVGHAEQAVLIPGATVFKRINPIYASVAETYPRIGENFHDDGDPQVVKYSQNALASNWAIQDGVKQALAAVRENDGKKVVIIGESMGSMVAWRTAVELAKDPGDLEPDDVRVVLIAPPEVGVAEYFKEGTFIPILNYRIKRIEQSPYDTTIVIGEYDGWSDPPDRPWNLASSANALAGIVYVHGPPSFTADLDDAELTDYVAADPKEGHGPISTYLLPTENLPLTQVFRDVGVPDALVDKADDVLRPVIDAGYVRHDQPGDTRPYLYDGEIHRNVQSQQLVREQSRELGETGQDVGQVRREHRSEVRQVGQAIRKNLRDLGDRVEAGIGQLKQKIAERRADREEPSE